MLFRSDAANDCFMALIPFRHVARIELNVFDRWGNRVYNSNDPYFKWDGEYQKQPCAEGVYFYHCTVYENRINGTAKRYLKGALTLIR